MATHNCGISSRSGVHPPGYAPNISSHKPSPFTLSHIYLFSTSFIPHSFNIAEPSKNLFVNSFICPFRQSSQLSNKTIRYSIRSLNTQQTSVVDVGERKKFWNDLYRVADRIANGYRFCVMGDLNGCVGDRMRVGIPGAFVVPGENDNGMRVFDL